MAIHPGRKPVHLTSGRKSTGRQAMWEEMRRQGKPFTARIIAHAIKANPDTVKSYLQGLVAANYVSKDGTEYTLVKDVGIEAPRVTKDGQPVTQGAAREQMWRSMRMMRGQFDFRELATLASTETVPVAETDATDYLQHLANAGYLQVTVKGAPGKPAKYRFIPSKNTGPRPPMIQRIKSVYDPNLRQVVWHAEVKDE
ncbi:MAG: hypothetical protein LDL39_12815 [Magnetospirillum sp.]|nr:hypothetical protein [Magnetospirillum sp.]